MSRVRVPLSVAWASTSSATTAEAAAATTAATATEAAERTAGAAPCRAAPDAGEIARVEIAGHERRQLALLLTREEAIDRRRAGDEHVHRRLASARVALVRLALVVALREVRHVLRDRAPDAVETDRVAAVHAGDAVGLDAAQTERVHRAEKLRHRVEQPARAVLRAELLLGDLLPLRLAPAIEHLRELLPLARRAD